MPLPKRTAGHSREGETPEFDRGNSEKARTSLSSEPFPEAIDLAAKALHTKV